MSETNTNTTASVKKHYDYASEQVDEQAILDKYNAATVAQFNAQREQNRQAENEFYNKMYDTQKTAMDTIRKSNAAAVSSGASRGLQAANELSALLGLEQESVASATEVAQANRQTAQEETAAVLENVLNAYQQATQERQQLTQQGIEAESVDVQRDANEVQREANDVAKIEAETNRDAQKTNEAATLVSASENGTTAYLAALGNLGYDYATTPNEEGYASLGIAIDGLGIAINGAEGNTAAIFSADDWNNKSTGASKANAVKNNVQQICKTYGVNYELVSDAVDSLVNSASEGASWWNSGKSNVANTSNAKVQFILNTIQNKYIEKMTAKTE